MSERISGFVATVAATALLAVSGGDSAPRAHEVRVVHAQEAAAETRERAHINTERPPLPGNIGAMAMNTVEIDATRGTVAYTDTTGKDLGAFAYKAYGSGTVVTFNGQKVVVTAAHVEASVSDHCSDQSIRYPATGSHAPFAGHVSHGSPAPTDREQHAGAPFYANVDTAVEPPVVATR